MAAQRKFEEAYPRAPRYTIELGDNEVLRFALSPKGSKAMHTRIVNLSESGMAFLVPYLSAPLVGELIKMEFTAPNTDAIACFARVRRVIVHKVYRENQKPQTFKLVAVEYENLHPKQRQELAKGLTEQFIKKRRQFQMQQLVLRLQWTARSFWNQTKSLFRK